MGSCDIHNWFSTYRAKCPDCEVISLQKKVQELEKIIIEQTKAINSYNELLGLQKKEK